MTRGMTMWRYELNKRIEKAQMWFAWRLPKWLVYWCVIRLWAHGTTGDYGSTHPNELLWDEALKRWGTP